MPDLSVTVYTVPWKWSPLGAHIKIRYYAPIYMVGPCCQMQIKNITYCDDPAATHILYFLLTLE